MVNYFIFQRARANIMVIIIYDWVVRFNWNFRSMPMNSAALAVPSLEA